MLKEEKIFKEFLKRNNLKQSIQRKLILRTFLKTKKHMTIDELYQLVREEYPNIGYATVYRTLKLLYQSGLGRELKFEDGIMRFEHNFKYPHHDHIICIKCKRVEEVYDPMIRKLYKKMAKKAGFSNVRHRLQIYGICKKCAK